MRKVTKSAPDKVKFGLTEGSSGNRDHEGNTWSQVDASKARIYFADGHVDHFENQTFAFALWLALPKGVKAAFRGKNDTRPVYPWDCADKPSGKEE